MEIVNDILKWIIFVFVTFFACEVITNHQKRISYIGTLLICFSSSVVQYINSGLIEAILTCELIFISLDKLLEKTQYQYLYSIAISVRNIRIFDVV
ncbi:MAG: hypothetical protein IJ629_05850 [Clostridia bacterium]|nr:hypothetical protein [Clostridia bacterium]